VEEVAVKDSMIDYFDNPTLEWRRLFSEVLGTFLLVIVAAGGGTVNAVSHGASSRAAA
jgi:aquaporin Z